MRKINVKFWIAAFCLCSAALSDKTNAQTLIDQGTCGASGSNLMWVLEKVGSDTVLTISGSGAMAGYGDKPWLDYLSVIKTVVIGDNVTSIGGAAFRNCSRLTSVTIPNSVTSIGDDAFAYCSRLTSVTIPNSVTSIGGAAFYNCSSLSSVTIGNSVTSIGDRAFGGCSSLSSVTIGNSVTSIGDHAFGGCSSLTSVTIPNSVTSIGVYAFGCSSLTSVHVAWNTPLSISRYTFANPSFSILYVPLGKVSDYQNAAVWQDFCVILDSPFNGDFIIRNDTLLRYVGNGGTVTIPNSVTSIGDYAFGCSSLTSVNIGNSVTSIGGAAFYNCSSLSSVTIGNSVTSIGNEAFYNCSSLSFINIPNSVTSIGSYAFENCDSLKSVTIPNSVTSIGIYAFYECSSLISVTIPNSVTSIGYYVFGYCDSLKFVTIPNSVTSIEDYAFRHCISLTSITIPENVTRLGDDAFSDCSSLQTVNFNAINCTGSGYAFRGNTAITTLNIGNSVKTIPNYAFSYCDSLTSVTIGNNVTSIGNNAFYGCVNISLLTLPLKSINYPYLGGLFYTKTNSSAVIGYNYQGVSGTTHYFIPSTLKTVTITDSDTIKSNFFQNCSKLTKVSAKNATVSGTAFGGCILLDTLIIGSIINNGDLKNLPALKYLAIVDETTTSLSNGFLQGCSNIKELTLPFIGTSPSNPSTLSSLFGGTVPNTLTKLTLIRTATNIQITDNALSGLSNLIELTLPSNVRGLGQNALYGCNQLEHIYSHWAYPPTAYDNSTFLGVNKIMCKLHVPMGSKQYYSVYSGWKEFFTPFDNIEEEAAVTLVARPIPLYGGVISGTLQYNYDDTAKLTATGNMGYDFQFWMENETIVSNNRTYSFEVQGARTLYAVFAPRENENSVQINVQPTEAVIVWNGEAGADGYTIIIYSDANRTQEYARFEFDANGKQKSTMSCTVGNLETNHRYYYTLTSYDKDNYKLNIAIGNFEPTASGSSDSLAITTTTLPNGTVGTTYAATLAAAGKTPITWTLEDGSLPSGLNLYGSGNISGTPTTAGTFNFTVKAKNATQEDSKTFSIVIENAGTGIAVGAENLPPAIRVYPNPVNYELKITNYELKEGEVVEIYSVVGQLVQTSPNPSKRGELAPSLLERAGGEVVIDISHLAKGLYFLKIGNQVTKFIKE